ncbi:PREDICTED: uncharacterized protein LOC104600932 [Nelumbo nucifera]|nr:PREDICTED: uncharacterized protein LOC104600932 [Nelumbo nucifera]
MSNNNHPRRVLTPWVSRKRKEREGFDALKASTTTTTTTSAAPKGEPASANKLLAGYLAQEFLTKGTLLGQKWDPARFEAAPIISTVAIESRKPNHHHRAAATTTAGEAVAEPKPTTATRKAAKHPSYDDVARLLKADGTHIAGIVNPKQLSEWLHM